MPRPSEVAELGYPERLWPEPAVYAEPGRLYAVQPQPTMAIYRNGKLLCAGRDCSFSVEYSGWRLRVWAELPITPAKLRRPQPHYY